MDLHGGNIYKDKIEYDFSVNVNPLGCDDRIIEAIRNSVGSVTNYPEYEANSLRTALGEVIGEKADKITITAGASEGFIGLMHLIKPKIGYVVTPCFSGYEYALNAINANVIRLDDLDKITEVGDYTESVVFLANPNNPDGKNISTDKLLELIRYISKHHGKVIVDECFLPLSDAYDRSLLGYTKDESIIRAKDTEDIFDDVYIVRSFTKTFAIPGIRLGYVVSPSGSIAYKLERLLPEWNVSNMAISAGKACLKCTDVLENARCIIKSEREFISKELTNLGLNVRYSNANFLLFSGQVGLKEKLINKGILIRDCSNYMGLETGYYRVAVKNSNSNRALIAAMKEIINE